MRNIQYLSPTSLSLYLKDKQEFYLNYLAEDRPDRFPQTEPMALGSSFDAFVKSYLHQSLFGKTDPKFEFQTLFEAQVEEQNRDRAKKNGEHIFNEYKAEGCLADIMLELSNSVIEPKFELDVKGVVNGYKEGITKKSDTGVVFLGKPDLLFVNASAARVILDWKVNGYYSAYFTSPMKGYIRLRQSRSNKGAHKEAYVTVHKGMQINAAHYLEQLNEDWARQLSIYAWLFGEEIGSDFIVAVDQVVGNPPRFAEHRLRIGSDFQFRTFAQAQEAWDVVHSDHYFRELTFEESKVKCESLDKMAATLRGEGTSNDKWFAKQVRGV